MTLPPESRFFSIRESLANLNATAEIMCPKEVGRKIEKIALKTAQIAGEKNMRQALLKHYEDLAARIFGNAQAANEIIIRFNRHFHWYQDEPLRKMNPFSLQDRSTSCSAAALLVGIHWKKMCDIEPIFLIVGDYTKAHAHVQVCLPKSKISGDDFANLFKQSGVQIDQFLSFEALYGTKNPDMLDPYASDGSIKLSLVQNKPRRSTPILGVDLFLTDRLRVFPPNI